MAFREQVFRAFRETRRIGFRNRQQGPAGITSRMEKWKIGFEWVIRLNDESRDGKITVTEYGDFQAFKRQYMNWDQALHQSNHLLNSDERPTENFGPVYRELTSRFAMKNWIPLLMFGSPMRRFNQFNGRQLKSTGNRSLAGGKPDWSLCLLIIGSILFWIADASADNRPNVLLLLSDDQRPDALGASGNTYIQTPHLDRLSRQGTRFTRAICANPICTPSRAEIFTGTTGFRNGVIDFGGRFREGVSYWPETMRRAGYSTWYVGKWHLRGRPTDFGIEECQGLFSGGGGKFWKDQKDWKGSPVTGYRGWVFQSADGKTRYPDRGVGLTPNISSQFADAAIEFLHRKTEKPFFLQVNFTAPHDPLIMPPGYQESYDEASIPLWSNFKPRHPFDHGNLEGRDEQLLPWPRTPENIRALTAMYYRVVSHMDQQIGRILEVLVKTGKADNTIVIFSSDHGLGVGSHGLRGKQNMYEHTIGVPLLMRGPGIKAGQISEAQVYLREIYPSVCELCGIEIPRQVQGVSFADVLSGKTDQIHDFVYGYFRDKQRMIRGKRWKLIEYPAVQQRQLFDLEMDPHELVNLAGKRVHEEQEEELARRLAAWRNQEENQ